jgi:hypothetical protein
MKKLFISVPVLMTIVLMACKSSDKEQTPTTTTTTTPANTPATTPTTTTNTNTTTPSQDVVPSGAALPPVSQPTTVTPAPTTAVKTAAGLNPAHGEPGHRCDIPVGSPLSTAPAKTTTPTIQPTVNPQPVTVSQPTVVNTAPATKVAPGMNPAHGEPGHRCDIPVGSPLNSPKAATNAPGVSIAPVTQPVKQ